MVYIVIFIRVCQASVGSTDTVCQCAMYVLTYVVFWVCFWFVVPLPSPHNPLKISSLSAIFYCYCQLGHSYVWMEWELRISVWSLKLEAELLNCLAVCYLNKWLPSCANSSEHEFNTWRKHASHLKVKGKGLFPLCSQSAEIHIAWLFPGSCWSSLLVELSAELGSWYVLFSSSFRLVI